MFVSPAAGSSWSLGAGAGLLLVCLVILAATCGSLSRKRGPTVFRRPGNDEPGGLSWIHGSLILIASVSCGLMGAGNRQLEIESDRSVLGPAREVGFATFTGIVCDATVSYSEASLGRQPTNLSGPEPRRSPPTDAPAGPEQSPGGTIRSIMVCIPGTRRPKRIRITFREKPVPGDCMHTGDRVLITGRPRAPRTAENPFGFDERRWLTALGVHAVVDDPARIRLVHDHSSVRSRARFIREQLRARIHLRFRYQRHRALATAILLGDRSDIDRRISDRFVRSGLMHLLALSGLHVGLIGGIVYLLIDSTLRRLKTGSRVRRLSGTVLWTIMMAAYGTVVGWPVSVVRALAMAAALMAASTAGRRASPWQVFGLAASALLILSPGHLYAAGFQLSFSAVGGLIFVRPEKDPHPALVKDRPDALRSLIQAARSSMAAGIATMPVLLFHFGSAPSAGILLSPPGILLMGPLLVSTILSAAFPAAVTIPFVHAAGAGFDALIALGGADPVWLPEFAEVPGRWSTSLALPILAGAALWIGGGRRRFRLLVTTTAAACALLAVEAVSSMRGPEHSIVFFYAGQGDAALIHSASGRTMLIDAAPGSVRPVRDYLEATGIERIDIAVLTHAHHDHIGGLTDLGRHIPVGRLVHTGWIRSSGSLEHRRVSAGDTLGLGPNVRVDVLSPDEITASHGNEDSVVLRVRIGEVRALFMADAESDAEARLVRRYGELLDAEIVKAGHHGSDTSSSPQLVRKTSPQFVVMSAGRNNRFGHPSPGIVERWQSSGADVHVTADRGALVLVTNGLDVKATSQ